METIKIKRGVIIIGKEKTYLIHSTKKYPDDLDSLFERFCELLETHEVEYIHGNADYVRSTILQMIEIGPREGLSSIFKIHKKQLKIEFVVQDETLLLNLTAKGIVAKQFKKLFAPFIIKSLNQAIRDLK
ncbi:MAG: hypothetical protein ACFFAS_04145 [Promethearchaeota archaeon]